MRKMESRESFCNFFKTEEIIYTNGNDNPGKSDTGNKEENLISLNG